GWDSTLKQAEDEELVKKNANGIYDITNKGISRIENILAERKKLLSKGVVIAGGIERKPVSIKKTVPITEEVKKVTSDIIRMELMFTAYQEILSDYGKKLRKEVSEIKKAFAIDDHSRIEEAKKVVALMPDPQKIIADEKDPENWINWFDLKDIMVLHMPLGYGCRRPCQQCLVGNGMFLSRNLPLPVAIKAIKPHNFGNWSGNELFDWYDPFFGTSLDGLIDYAMRKDSTAHFTITTAGWPKLDKRAQKIAENINGFEIDPIVETSGFNVSFHLGQPYYDIVRKIYEYSKKGGSISDPTEEDIAQMAEPYIEHYANILGTLSPHLRHIYFCYTKNPSLYNLVSTYAFKKALEKADWNSFDLKINVTRSIEGVDPDDTRNFLVYQDLHDAQSDEVIGRSVDFLNRLDLAEKGDPACLKIDESLISDRSAPKTKYPLVSITHNGYVQVESHIDGRILARTTINIPAESVPLTEINSNDLENEKEIAAILPESTAGNYSIELLSESMVEDIAKDNVSVSFFDYALECNGKKLFKDFSFPEGSFRFLAFSVAILTNDRIQEMNKTFYEFGNLNRKLIITADEREVLEIDFRALRDKLQEIPCIGMYEPYDLDYETEAKRMVEKALAVKDNYLDAVDAYLDKLKPDGRLKLAFDNMVNFRKFMAEYFDELAYRYAEVCAPDKEKGNGEFLDVDQLELLDDPRVKAKGWTRELVYELLEKLRKQHDILKRTIEIYYPDNSETRSVMEKLLQFKKIELVAEPEGGLMSVYFPEDNGNNRIKINLLHWSTIIDTIETCENEFLHEYMHIFTLGKESEFKMGHGVFEMSDLLPIELSEPLVYLVQYAKHTVLSKDWRNDIDIPVSDPVTFDVMLYSEEAEVVAMRLVESLKPGYLEKYLKSYESSEGIKETSHLIMMAHLLSIAEVIGDVQYINKGNSMAEKFIAALPKDIADEIRELLKIMTQKFTKQHKGISLNAQFIEAYKKASAETEELEIKSVLNSASEADAIFKEVSRSETLADTIKISASEAMRENAKVIIGIETAEWMPNEQNADMQALMCELRQLVDRLKRRGIINNITIVLGNSETLLRNIGDENPSKTDKIILLGSKNTLTNDKFQTLEAFKACIDLKNLGSFDYISLLEIITIALNLGLNEEDDNKNISSHRGMEIISLGKRIVLLVPTERIDINTLPNIYGRQIKELAKQA
ncbi:MAG: hypothetical protein HQL29_04465, partial [Candidatus Omnitrophica bacterium]|nr:hypothetical protein [Candidatus Omnitrophota bacterium]